jgi:succinylglutamic semialdehyde dehydrogenase
MRTDLYINGDWRTGAGAAFSAINPASGEPVWQGRAADDGDVGEAVQAAQAAFGAWSHTPMETREALVAAFAKAMEAKAEALALRITQEMGKALWDARTEAQAVIGKAALSIKARRERAGEQRADAAFGYSALHHRPLGVMAVLGPFNFPAHLPNGHIIPALLAGNTVVFKPSEMAPGVAAMMAETWAEVGLPKGVLNLVHGAGDVGQALVQAPGLAGVLFTGSHHAGAAIHRHFAGRPEIMVALEMGGNAPLIVWPPVDSAAAANLIVHSAYVTSGQRCTCSRRLILPQDAFGDAVITALEGLIDGLKIGPGENDPQPFMGPLVSERAAVRLVEFQERLVRGGGQPLRSAHRSGAFVTPGLIDMTGAQGPDEEAFGPLLQVFREPTLEAAIARANATRFGLAAGVISDDPSVWEQAGQRLRAGVLNWNRPTTGASGALPFGGPGLSGSLRPSAAYAADYCAYPVATQAAAKAEALPAPGLPT